MWNGCCSTSRRTRRRLTQPSSTLARLKQQSRSGPPLSPPCPPYFPDLPDHPVSDEEFQPNPGGYPTNDYTRATRRTNISTRWFGRCTPSPSSVRRLPPPPLEATSSPP